MAPRITHKLYISVMKYIIVGTGNISATYVRAIGNLPQCDLVGFVSRSGWASHGATGLPVWPTLEAVDQVFDAVVLATPNGLHSPGITSAAALGKHVVTEKPLGIRSGPMQRAISACDEAGVTLAVAYQRRTAPDNRAAKQLLDDGRLGRVFAADLSAKFYRDQAYYDSADYRGGYAIDGGGPFIQQACHNIDIYVWLFGLPDQVVSMLGTFTHDMEAEDHGAALLRHADGMIGTIVASSAARPGFAARLEVHTDTGSFTLTDDVITGWHFPGVPNPTDPGYHYGHDGATSLAVHDTSAHEAILTDFERAVTHGLPPIVDAESARRTTELILRIYEAGRDESTSIQV